MRRVKYYTLHSPVVLIRFQKFPDNLKFFRPCIMV